VLVRDEPPALSWASPKQLQERAATYGGKKKLNGLQAFVEKTKIAAPEGPFGFSSPGWPWLDVCLVVAVTGLRPPDIQVEPRRMPGHLDEIHAVAGAPPSREEHAKPQMATSTIAPGAGITVSGV
jgi:hypothetical protein